jgi:tetratricopeptide (TPR) repeat protein
VPPFATQPRPPLVFISYDLHAVELQRDVLGLANRLRQDGVDARIDLYEPGPAEGWELWRERQLLAAERVVVVCTASYRRFFEAHEAGADGLQVKWEAGFLRRRLHDDPSFGARVLPVVPHGASAEAVPEVLRSCTRYTLPGGYEELYRRITGQPAIVGPPLGTLAHRIDNLGPRSPVFEGREDALEATREALRRSSKLMTYTVLAGMGGIGKTRLALEHAHRGEADYELRWRVRAGDLTSLQADLVQLGVALGILAQPEQVEASTREVLAWLSTHQRWLVVFDDAEGSPTIRRLLPSPCRGHVLITSRKCAWRSMAQVVELGRLSPQAAKAALVQRGGRPDDGHADAVAMALGHLPLALVQAGAYVEATGCSFHDYLDRFEHEGLALLDDPKSVPDGDHQTVATTWEISLTEVRTRSPAAAALLDWLAFLDPGGVPIALLGMHTEIMPAPLRACMGSPRALDDAVAVLLEFGMIERDEGMLRVHRLIQAVTRGKLAPDERQPLAVAVVRWLCAAFAYTPGKTLIRNVPVGIAEQIMAASAIDECLHTDGERIAQLLIDVGDFHLTRGASHAAHTAYTRLLALREARAKARPTCTRAQRGLSIALNRLGAIATRAGSLMTARRCFSRAFALRKALAYQDPLSPRSQDDLASSLSKLGDVALLAEDVAAAAELFTQAVELCEALAEAAPADLLAQRALALSSRKLGKARARLGDSVDARRTLQRALAIVEALARAEPRNPVAGRDLSRVLHDLGDMLVHEGEADLARELRGRALAIAEALAAEDPGNAQAQRELSIGLNRWGLAEQHAGRFALARGAMERALALRQALARANPQDLEAQHDLVLSFDKLAELETLAGNTSVASEHRRRAADIRQTLVSERSSDVDAWEDREPAFATPRSRSHDVTLPSPAAPPWDGRVEPEERTAGVHAKYLQAVDHASELEQLGTSALRSGNLETARQSLRLLTAITNVLAKVDPRPIPAQRRAASALYELGKAELALGDLESARERLRRCCELYTSLLEVVPTDAPTRRGLATCLGTLGRVELERGEPARARELMHRCRQRFDALVVDAPRDVATLREFGTSLVELGRVEGAAGDVEAARELFQRNLDLAYAIVELEPSSMRARLGVLHALRRLAEVEVQLGNLPEARELFRLMLEDDDVLTRADPEDAWAALDLVLLYAEPSSPAA